MTEPETDNMIKKDLNEWGFNREECNRRCPWMEAAKDAYRELLQDPLREINADLLAALEATQARINGEWDSPALVAYGPLGSDAERDILCMIGPAIAKAKGE